MGVQKQPASGIWTTGHSVLSLVYKVKFWTTQLQFKALTQLSGFVSCYDRAAHSPLFQWWAFHTFAQALPLARQVSPFSPTQILPILWGSGQILLLCESWSSQPGRRWVWSGSWYAEHHTQHQGGWAPPTVCVTEGLRWRISFSYIV